jgi:hypothetical protein
VASACSSDNGTKAARDGGAGEGGDDSETGGTSSQAGSENSSQGGSVGKAGSASSGGTEPGGGAPALGGADAAGGADGVAGRGSSAEGGAGAAGASGAEAGASGAPFLPCEGGPRCLNETTAAVCPESGVLQTLPCTNGCVDDACAPTDLSTGWILHQYTLQNDLSINAAYTFTQNGLSALQTQNSMPSVYYLDRDLSNVRISGSFAVETTSDDDLVGFVFGLQDTEHFYLFDWKQATQNDGTCGNAEIGAALKLISSSSELQLCQDFWSSSATANMQVLSAPAQNPTGWLDNTVYTFTLHHRPGHIEISVKLGTDTVASISSNDATYTHGRFGFYNYSQESSRYQFFDIQPE